MPYLDRRFASGADRGEPVLKAITDCPFCRSTTITTTSKTVTQTTYWRCLACGEVWNPSRVVVGRPAGRRW